MRANPFNPLPESAGSRIITIKEKNPVTDPIQQQLVAARKNQILDAAAAVFAEKGFHPTTIQDIAKTAGIAGGTIYNYFDSKPALLMGIFERMREAIVEDARANPLPVASEMDLHAFVKMTLSHPMMARKGDDFALFRIVVSEMMVSEEMRALYYEQILKPTLSVAETYLEEQGLSPADAGLTIRAISGMVMGLMLEHIMGDADVQARWEELPDFLADLIVDGLSQTLLQD